MVATDTLAFSSGSEEALGRDVYFMLDAYATVTALVLEFLVGDTYKLDLELYRNDEYQLTVTIRGEPFMTITVRPPYRVRAGHM